MLQSPSKPEVAIPKLAQNQKTKVLAPLKGAMTAEKQTTSEDSRPLTEGLENFDNPTTLMNTHMIKFYLLNFSSNKHIALSVFLLVAIALLLGWVNSKMGKVKLPAFLSLVAGICAHASYSYALDLYLRTRGLGNPVMYALSGALFAFIFPKTLKVIPVGSRGKMVFLGTRVGFSYGEGWVSTVIPFLIYFLTWDARKQTTDIGDERPFIIYAAGGTPENPAVTVKPPVDGADEGSYSRWAIKVELGFQIVGDQILGVEEEELEKRVVGIVNSVIRAFAAGMQGSQIIAKKQELARNSLLELRGKLRGSTKENRDALSEWGVIVTLLNIKSIEPANKELADAMEEKAVATARAQASKIKNEAALVRLAALKQVIGDDAAAFDLAENDRDGSIIGGNADPLVKAAKQIKGKKVI